jgi:peptide/nickel transport system permease protein
VQATLNFILKRLFLGLVSLVLAAIIVSSVIFLVPVDPARMTFGQRLDPEALEQKTRDYGLDRSLPGQLSLYFRDLSPINFWPEGLEKPGGYSYLSVLDIGESEIIVKWPFLRESYQSGRPVWDLLRETWPQTMILAITAMLFATILGVTLGVISAVRANTVLDKILMSFAVLGYSVPSYVSALFFSLVFGFFLHNITGLNLQGSLMELDHRGVSRWQWSNLVLPALALGVRPVAVIMQMTRSTMIGILKSPYVLTARSKGLKEGWVVIRHALTNAANPIISTTSGWLASLLSGAFFVESIFNFYGIGSTTVDALLYFDIPVLLGAIISVAAIFVVINLLTDLAYKYFDPSIKLE